MKKNPSIFFENTNPVELDSKVILVEINAIKDHKRPKELSGFRRYQLWKDGERSKSEQQVTVKSDTKYKDYFFILNDLVRFMVNRLEEGSNQKESPKEVDISIFLAETTPDLYTQRMYLRNELQKKFRILPDIGHYFTYLVDPKKAQESLREDLKSCKLFVQILSDNTMGRPLEGGEWSGYNSLQFKEADQEDRVILQWHKDSPESEFELDVEYNELLENDEIYRNSFPNFVKEVLKQTEVMTLTVPNVGQKASIPPKVFLNSHEADRTLLPNLQQDFHNMEADCIPLPYNEKEQELEAYVKALRKPILGVVVLYGNSDFRWAITEAINYRDDICQNIKYAHQNPDKVQIFLGFYDGPPQLKSSNVSIKNTLSQIDIFDCRNGFDDKQIKPFLRKIQLGIESHE